MKLVDKISVSPLVGSGYAVTSFLYIRLMFTFQAQKKMIRHDKLKLMGLLLKKRSVTDVRQVGASKIEFLVTKFDYMFTNQALIYGLDFLKQK